ncbi:hypothetical protein ABZV93_06890 [Actinopolymorpha sp. NPDC004070]|uniref:baeRF2 domain-containing protein n=1 Tax=Actinopolymorpha sp. NPDC004070 TaxID=3154548 RepID=UPI0033B1BAC5
MVDSSGADFVVRGAPASGHGAGGHGGEGHAEVRGEQRPLHKVRGGALSNRRMQNSVKETADRNARLVADNIVRLVESAAPVWKVRRTSCRPCVRARLTPSC